MSFKIEGWLPPIRFKSITDGKTYAVCGSNWIEVPETMTSEEIMKGWICTPPKEYPKNPTYKKPTKGQLQQKTAKPTMDPNDLIKKLMQNRKARLAKQQQPSLF